MKGNRLLIVLSLLVMVALFAACAAPASPSAAPAASAEEAPAAEAPAAEAAAPADGVVEIEYWQYNFASRIGVMDELIAQFEAENPGIRVIHNSEIPYDSFRDTIAARVPAGTGPDVVSLCHRPTAPTSRPSRPSWPNRRRSRKTSLKS